MGYSSENLQNLKREGRFDARIAGELRTVEDLSRTDVIVHVGKPVGSVTGWVGPIFWQVWVEPGEPTGKVFARIDRGQRQEWMLDASLTKEALLEAAQQRAISVAKSTRESQLLEARRRLEDLKSAT